VESVAIDGVRIAYERAGQGPAVLLLGGTGMPPITWQVCGLREAVTQAGFEVITYAARGVAPSDAPPAPYSVEQMAGDAAGLLEALGLRDAVLVGYSLGSFAAEVLARTRPDLVRAAVLLAGAGPTSPLLSATLAMERELIAVTGRIPGAAAAFQTLFTGLPQALLSDDDLVAQWTQMLGFQSQMWTSPDGEAGQAAAADAWQHNEDRMDALREITVPVLVAAFEHDPLFPPRTSRVAADMLPLGEFAEIPHAAHAGLMTHPVETRRVILEFLVTMRGS
jgi:pimeloyl-ACP methyl ester carboxylesterase